MSLALRAKPKVQPKISDVCHVACDRCSAAYALCGAELGGKVNCSAKGCNCEAQCVVCDDIDKIIPFVHCPACEGKA